MKHLRILLVLPLLPFLVLAFLMVIMVAIPFILIGGYNACKIYDGLCEFINS